MATIVVVGLVTYAAAPDGATGTAGAPDATDGAEPVPMVEVPLVEGVRAVPWRPADVITTPTLPGDPEAVVEADLAELGLAGGAGPPVELLPPTGDDPPPGGLRPIEPPPAPTSVSRPGLPEASELSEIAERSPGAGDEEAGDEAGSPGPAIGGPVDGDGGETATEAGPLADELTLEPELRIPDRLPLVDPCAAPSAPDDCGAGVGGTILLAVEGRPMRVWAAVAPRDDRCAAELGELPRDRFPLEVHTNQPAELVVRAWASGSDGDPLVVEASTSAAARDEFVAGGSEVVTTCVALRRLDATTRYLVEVEGTNDVLDVGRWDGEVRVEGTGRPPVRIRPRSDRTFEIAVPAESRERVQVSVFADSDEPEVRSCEDGEAVLGATPGALPQLAVSDGHRRTARRPGDPPTTFDVEQRFRAELRQGGRHHVCVTWLLEFDPDPTVVERQAFVVRAPRRPQVRLEVADVQLDVAPPDGRTGFDMSLTDALRERLVCVEGVEPDAVPVELCRFEAVDSMALADFGSSSPWGPVQAALRFPMSPCPECIGFYDVPLPVPEGGDAPAGTIELRAYYGPESWPADDNGWVTDAVGSYGDAEVPGPDGWYPRLNLGATRIFPDPSDPARRVVFEWEADRPVVARVDLDPHGEPRCFESPPIGFERAESPAPATSGRLVVDACPGETYEPRIGLLEVGGPASSWGGSAGPGGPVPHTYVPLSVETERLEVRYRVSMRTRLSEEATPDRLNPPSPWTRVNVAYTLQERGIDGSEHHRLEDRTGIIVESGLTCRPVGAFDRAFPQAFTARAGPSLFVDAGAEYQVFDRCGEFVETARGPAVLWSVARVEQEIPVFDVLDGPVVVVGRRQLCTDCARRPWLNLELTVTAEEIAER
jgi:hypothetical protein